MERRWVGLGDKLAESEPSWTERIKGVSEVYVENIQVDKYVVQLGKKGEQQHKGIDMISVT